MAIDKLDIGDPLLRKVSRSNEMMIESRYY